MTRNTRPEAGTGAIGIEHCFGPVTSFADKGENGADKNPFNTRGGPFTANRIPDGATGRPFTVAGGQNKSFCRQNKSFCRQTKSFCQQNTAFRYRSKSLWKQYLAFGRRVILPVGRPVSRRLPGSGNRTEAGS
jgi:hypothetical protein